MTLDIKRILVPVDFSAHAARALDYARGLAQKFEASIHLVHVCEVPTAAIDAYALVYTDWSQQLGVEAERQLLELRAGLGDVTVTSEVLFGRPPRAILDAAGMNDSDLIVMGTHGHGALMHMLLGNVAERVVRTAPCPVLTVGEPKVKKARNVATHQVAGVIAAAVVILAVLAPGLVTPASAQEYKQTTTGAEIYRTYCATCHGTAARGDGPLASSMVKKPANLTEIAKRNGGQFPSEMVFKTIDGRQPVRGHGGADMPVWGDAFSKSREAGDAERVKAVIQSLVDFLDSIQLRASHEPQ